MDDPVPPGDLPRPPGVPRQEARLWRMPAGRPVPVVRRRTDRYGPGRAAGQGPRDRTPAGPGQGTQRVRVVPPRRARGGEGHVTGRVSAPLRWLLAGVVVVAAVAIAVWPR